MHKDDFYFNACFQRQAVTGHKHYHNAAEFYLMAEGQCSYLIDDRLYSVETGDLVLIPKQVIHSTTYAEQYSRYLINCRERFWEGIPFPSMPVFRNPALAGEILAIFKEIGQEYRRDDSYSPLLLRGAIHRLFALLERSSNLYPTDRGSNRLIEAILRELNKNYSGEVTLGDTARRHCISPAHLSRTFKRETGMNFNEYLSLLRLKKAEQLLKEEPHLPIGEIAFSCGFNDSNYFSEKFHAAHNCSPSAFRKKEG